MSEENRIDDPTIKLLETLRKRDKLQSPVEREAASYIHESENLLEEQVLEPPENPLDDLEQTMAGSDAAYRASVKPDVEPKPESMLPAEVEESKIQVQFLEEPSGKLPSILSRFSDYFKRWVLGEQHVVGIDIDGNFVKMVKISNSLKGKVLTHFMVCEIIGDGGIKSNKDIISTLSSLLPGKVGKGVNVSISVSGPQTVIKQFVLPKLTQKEMKQALQWQAQKNLPFPIENTIYDYVIGRGSDAQEVLSVTLMAVEKSFLKSSLSNFEKSDIKVSKVSTPPFAIFDILRLTGKEDGESTIVIIDIAWDRMTITFISKGMIQFIRDIPVGVAELVDGLQGSITFRDKSAVISEGMARRLLDKYGIPLELIDSYMDEDLEINSISQQMSGSVDRIVEEVLRSLNYFKKKFPDFEEADTLYISGQGADLYNMGLLFRRTTNKRIERINPLLGIAVDENIVTPSAFTKVASTLTVAAGLARNFFDGPNIAPEDAKNGISFGVVKKLFSIATLLLLLILSFFTYSVKIDIDQKKAIASEAESHLASLSPIQQQYLSSNKEIVALLDLVSIMDSEEKKGIWLRSQLRLLSALSPPEMMLSRVDIRTSVTQIDQDKGVSFVQLTGAIFADDFFSRQIIKDYQDALLNTKLYSNVEITESNFVGTGGARAMFFVINCFL